MIKFKLMKQDNNEQLVDARELWIQLDVKRDFTTWIKGRIERYRFVENVDFMHSLNFPQLETTVKDYKQKELKRIGTINAADVRWSTCQTVEMLHQKLDEDIKLLQKVFERFSYNKAEMSLYIKQLKNYV